MSWSITISGHKTSTHPWGTPEQKRESEENEALIVAEIDALLPQLVSRLKGHGLHGIALHGNEVHKQFVLPDAHSSTG